MACPSVLTGKEFLASTLAHIDCQAQTLGSYGYMALAQPGSSVSVALTGLLTVFVGLLGFRLLFGPAQNGGDLVRDVLNVAVVLTLAVSWPAWRTLVYDVTLRGPAELASSIAPTSLPYQTPGGFAARLQNIDTGLIALTVRGTGRNVGELTKETAPPAGFRGVALEDDTGFASARLIFLSATIGSLAIVRLAAGLLLAITPLVVGLLLFETTRGLFSGWLRGLVLTALGSVGITIVLAVEIAVLEPLMVDALRLRELGYATPAAPTELLAITAAFAFALCGMMILLGKISFQQGWGAWRLPSAPRHFAVTSERHSPQSLQATIQSHAAPSRAVLLSERMATTVRQEREASLAQLARSSDPHIHFRGKHESLVSTSVSGRLSAGGRTFRRVSAAATRRDAGT